MPSGNRAQPFTGPPPGRPPALFGGLGDYPDGGAAGAATAGGCGCDAIYASFSATAAIETNSLGTVAVARFEAVNPGQRWELEHLRVGHQGYPFLVGIGVPNTTQLQDVVDGIEAPPGTFSVLDCAPVLRVAAGEQLYIVFQPGTVGLQARAQLTIKTV